MLGPFLPLGMRKHSTCMKVLDNRIRQSPLAFPDLQHEAADKRECGSDRSWRVVIPWKRIALLGAGMWHDSTLTGLRNGMICFHDIGLRPTREHNFDDKQTNGLLTAFILHCVYYLQQFHCAVWNVFIIISWLGTYLNICNILYNV